MKIVLFDYVFDLQRPGETGLSDLVWNWARESINAGDEVHIVAPYPEGTMPPRGVIVHTYDLPIVAYRNVVGHLLIILRGWTILRKIKGIDLVHCPEYLSTAVLGVLVRNAPVVLTVPGNINEHIQHANPFDWTMTHTLRVAAWMSARLCTLINATSTDMKKWWERSGTPPPRMVIIPHGVDTDFFRPIPRARAELGIRPDTRVVLYVGRLDYLAKGLDLLLSATERLVRKKESNLELHIVGSGESEKLVREHVRTMSPAGVTYLHGWVDREKLPLFYSAADVSVLPSRTEGLPRVMLEAMACGCPFLGTRVSGIVDVIEDGVTGFLVPPDDLDALTSKLREILANESRLRWVGRNARNYVERALAWPVIGRRIRNELYIPALARFRR